MTKEEVWLHCQNRITQSLSDACIQHMYSVYKVQYHHTGKLFHSTYFIIMMILSLTLIWALSSTAGALEQCSNNTSTCSSGSMCVTASIQVNSSGPLIPQNIGACVPSSLCPATGNQTFSFKWGVSRQVGSLQCCNTSNCNSGNLNFPPAQPNNLTCFTCNSTTSQCNSELRCQGVENRCVNVTSGSSNAKLFGCISSNLCDLATNQNGLSFLQSIANITGGISCCGTSLCNAVTTTSTTKTPPTKTTTKTPPTPTTTKTTTTTTTTASDACCIRLSMIHLLLGLLLFTLF
ncbi:urokinase plasminogen activator surface receptor-like [Micropterus salmoides]|uniref:urokinase plasminogen activator surface receptor-like n=1 Tax=Micropterus salmoides TaxID=27706 RepID=UPI0018EBAF02|nr:urokinase plasminogen activator surface receptor-like [Micropterus salmoides]